MKRLHVLAAFSIISMFFLTAPSHAAPVNSTMVYENFDSIAEWTVSGCWASSGGGDTLNGTSTTCKNSGTTQTMILAQDMSSTTRVFLNIRTVTVALDAGETLDLHYNIGAGWNLIVSIPGDSDNSRSIELPSEVVGDPDFQIRLSCINNKNNEKCQADDMFIIDEADVDVDPPTYSLQGQNTSSPSVGEPVLLSVNWTDTSSLNVSVLETNETGEFRNKTGFYGSPFDVNLTADETWSNFTWQNSSVLPGTTVSWRVYTNDSLGNINVSNMFNFTVAGASGYLEVNLSVPDPVFTTNIVQNQSITVNATVFCRSASCGNVNATLRYNGSSEIPDTPVNTSEGEDPFHIDEPPFPSASMKTCPTNPLSAGEFCNITWEVNASGPIGTNWQIGSLFNSSDGLVEQNHTSNASISITTCSVDFTLNWASISFGFLNPGSVNNSAPGNTVNDYNTTVNQGSCNTDLYITGIDLRNVTYDRNISVGNMSWSNVSSNPDDAQFRLSIFSSLIRSAVSQGNNATTWYWLDVPPTFAGIYNTTITITGVINGDPPP